MQIYATKRCITNTECVAQARAARLTNTITSPVIGFILDPKGLMYNLTLEGSKISRISR